MHNFSNVFKNKNFYESLELFVKYLALFLQLLFFHVSYHFFNNFNSKDIYLLRIFYGKNCHLLLVLNIFR